MMDKYKEAIKHLKRTVSQLKYLDEYQETPYTKYYIRKRNEKNRRRLQASRLAIEALEKQIPKKPRELYNWCDLSKEERAESYKWYCQECYAKLSETENYCPNCGQKLDWRNT